ncbi:MAG: hypothetical protein ACJA1B_001413 [Polaribacter sp.]|jgi:hypothetical protein
MLDYTKQDPRDISASIEAKQDKFNEVQCIIDSGKSFPLFLIGRQRRLQARIDALKIILNKINNI